MRPVSARFLAALTGSHAAPVRVRVCVPNQTGTTPAGTEVAVITGDVQIDATADVRSTVDVTVQEPWPDSTTDLITPYGAELFVERGIRYADGSTEWVSLGYFRLYDVEQQDVPSGSLRLTGQDRMSAIADARVTAPRQFATSVSVGSLFDTLVAEVLPGVSVIYDFSAYSRTFPTSHVLEEDRKGFLDDIAAALGKQFYFGYDGNARLQDIPLPANPVWTVKHGRDGVLVSASRSRSRSGVYNGVVATGDQASDTTAPARGIALDLAPGSPTYWYGPYGQVPRFFSSSFITSASQASSAAAALLAKVTGLPSTFNFASIVNPALEALDPVAVTYDDRHAATVYLLDRITIPLDPGGVMACDTRQQALADEDGS